jgi:ArsR family transcriptional regulator
VEPLVVLQAIADPVRWAVLAMLVEAPRCVCKLQEQIPIAGNLLSYHLKVLREAGLVPADVEGGLTTRWPTTRPNVCAMPCRVRWRR